MPRSLPVLADSSPIVCMPLGGACPLTEEEALGLAVRLKALADPVRLRLLSYLLDQAGLEACTCDLAPVVGLSDPTVSHHLKKLETSGLLTKERRGMSVYYRVVPEALDAIGQTLRVEVR